MAQFMTVTAFAEDTLYREFNVSAASVINETGFLQGTVPADCTAAMTTEDGIKAIALRNGFSASNSASNLVYNQSWSSVRTSSFVLETSIKLNNLNGNKRVDFRFTDGTYDYVLDIRNNELYINRVLSDFVLEEKWYTVQIVVQETQEENVAVYFDGVLAGSYRSAQISKYKESNVQMRIEAIGKNTEMSIGDTKIYKPGRVRLLIKDSILETVNSPVNVQFDRPIRPSLDINGIRVAAEDGTEVRIAGVTAQTDAGGNITGLTVEFAENLSKKKVYRVIIGEAEGVIGQGVETESETFTVIPDDFDYVISDIKVFKGMGSGKKAIGSLQNGFITFEVTVKNDGIKLGEGIMAVEVYNADDRMIYSGGVKKSVGGGASVSAFIGAYLTEIDSNSYAKIRFIDNYADKNDLTDAVRGGDIF